MNPSIGLCSSCRHTRPIHSDRGSIFHQCTRALKDPAYPKYPRLPVLHCIGHEPLSQTPLNSKLLICPVRDCGQPLTRDQRRAVCPRGHSFDTARSGYLNLLQPQERRSREPGDSAAAVAARRRLHDRGVTAPLLQAIAAIAAPTASDTVLDAGCGDGYYLGTLQSQSGCDAHGVDISIPAIDAAARRYPACEWIVANADRAIPYADRSFSLILSITARMNVSEFHRVLAAGGRLLVAIPAPEDLIELRGEGRDRAERTIESFAPAFTLQESRRVTTQADLDAAAVHDALLSIYRPRGLEAVHATRVTFSLELLLFRPIAGVVLPLNMPVEL